MIGIFSVGFDANNLCNCCCRSRNSCWGEGPDGTAGYGVSAVAGEFTGAGSDLTPIQNKRLIPTLIYDE